MTGHSRKYRDSSADLSFHSVIDCLTMKLDENGMVCFFSDLMRFRYGVHEIFVFYPSSEGSPLTNNDALLPEYLSSGHLAALVCVGKHCPSVFMFIFYFKINGEKVSNATCRSNK